jgi:hypothetical protein
VETEKRKVFLINNCLALIIQRQYRMSGEGTPVSPIESHAIYAGNQKNCFYVSCWRDRRLAHVPEFSGGFKRSRKASAQ